MTVSSHKRIVIDVHVHVHPARAEFLATVMEANHLCGVVNLGILEALDIPFEDSLRAFRKVLGERIVYFSTPNFRDTAPGGRSNTPAFPARGVGRWTRSACRATCWRNCTSGTPSA